MRLLNSRLKVTNYRSFVVPFELQLESGLIALVGPNNGGKSNVLRFFFELRPLFQLLSRPEEMRPNLHHAFIQAGNLGAQITFNRVADRRSAFPVANDEPMLIEVFISRQPEDRGTEIHFTPDSLLITIDREGGVAIQMRAEYGIASQTSIVQGTNLVFDGRHQRRFDLTAYIELFRELSEAFYIGSFRNLVNQGANSEYFDLAIGTELVNRWRTYQAGDDITQATAAIAVISELKRVFRFTNLQLLPSANGNDIRAIVDDRPFLLSELGSGVSQFFIAIVNLELSKKRIVLIDEPELGLHPQLQNELLQSIACRAETVFFTTHSLGLARNMANKVYTVSRNGPGTTSTLRDFNGLHNPTELLGELSYAGNYDLGYRKILLVEGPSEVRFVRTILNKIDVNNGVLPISLGGSSMLAKCSASRP